MNDMEGLSDQPEIPSIREYAAFVKAVRGGDLARGDLIKRTGPV